jgi:hypothetical protein
MPGNFRLKIRPIGPEKQRFVSSSRLSTENKMPDRLRPRAIQGWLGHRSITSTAVYTALSPNRSTSGRAHCFFGLLIFNERVVPAERKKGGWDWRGLSHLVGGNHE